MTAPLPVAAPTGPWCTAVVRAVTHPRPRSVVLRLEVPAVLDLLAEIFPAGAGPDAGQDYGEPPAPRMAGSYVREQTEVIAPMRELFGILREISTAVTHEVGSFG